MENIFIGVTGILFSIIGALIAGYIVTMIVGINSKIGETKNGNLVVFIITAIITFIILVSMIKWA